MMKSKTLILICVFYHIASISTLGQTLQSSSRLNNRQSGFTENKGQITDQSGQLRLDVKYLYINNGFKLHLKENSFSYELYNQKVIEKESDIIISGRNEPQSYEITSHRIDIELIGANKTPHIVATDASEDYSNYYLSHTPERGVGKVYSYERITYYNIYPNIDMEFYTSAQSIKYNFVVHAGGNPEDIRIAYKGAESVNLDDSGKLQLKTVLGNVSESITESYTTFVSSGSTKRAQVNVNFNLNGNVLHFKVSEYDKKHSLIIDPYINWATYYGGTLLEFTFRNAIDAMGNSYMCGSTRSAAGIASNGSYQSTYSGGVNYDGYFVKFSPKGERIWGTYFGGSNTDDCRAIIADSSSVYVLGNTSSSSGISTGGAFQAAIGGGVDNYLAKFDSSGSRIWATYWGGNGDDIAYNLAKDKSGNLVHTGQTFSSTGISTGGSYQVSFAGVADAYVTKFNSSGSRIWSTYYGGTGNDWGTTITTDDLSNIIFGGVTSSASGIASSGSYQASSAGADDGFLVKLSPAGTRLWGTYFGGTLNERIRGVKSDSLYYYITGSTESTNGIATSSAHNVVYGGGVTDCFLARFNSSGQRNWSTYYGGSSDEYSSDVAVDRKGRILIAGSSWSSDSISTPDGYHVSKKALGDAFVSLFDTSGVLKWGSYFGGSDEDSASGIAVANNYFAVTGRTGSGDFAITPNAYQTANAGTGDGFQLLFNFNQATEPKTAASSLLVTNVTTNSMKLSWTKGSGNRSLLIVKATLPVSKTPIDGPIYYGDSVFLQGNNLGTGNFVIYADTGNAVNLTGLSPATRYYFTVYTYNVYDDSASNYLLPGSNANAITLALQPTIASQNLSFSNITANSMQLDWTRGNGAGHIVIARKDSAVSLFPEDGGIYNPNDSFGIGQDLGNGNFVVYDGTSDSLILKGLLPGTKYHFAVMEYNGTAGANNYLLSSYLSGSQYTLSTEPLQASSSLIFSNIGNNNMQLNWTKGSGKYSVVVIREDLSVSKMPIDGNDYSASSTFTLGDDLGNGNYVAYRGTGNSFTLTGLKPSRFYHAAVIEMNGDGDSANYLTSSILQGNENTLANEPLTSSSNIIFSNIAIDSMRISWTRGSGQNSMVLVKKGSAVDQVPADAQSYSVNNVFGSGAQLGSGNYAAYLGNGNSFSLKGLLPNTPYHVAIFEMNGQGDSANYMVLTLATDSSYTLAEAFITAAGSVSFCKGDSVLLNAKTSASVGYLWKKDGNVIPNANDSFIYASASGDYTVEVTNSAGTNTSAAVTITVNTATVPVITIVNPASFYCQGDSIQLNTIASGTLLWSNGKIGNTIYVKQSGSYSVTVTGSNGCKATSANTVLTVHPNPPIPVITQIGDTLVSSTADYYQWLDATGELNGAIQQRFVPATNGKYRVTVSDSSGCEATSAEFTYVKTSLSEQKVPVQYRIFPNPNTGAFEIQLNSYSQEPQKIQVTNLLGGIVYVTATNEGAEKFNISMGNVPAGLYFIQYSQGEYSFIAKMIVY